MKSALSRVEDWEVRSLTARYNVAAVARECKVSVRHLERYFVQTFGQSPHKWLHELRMRRAVELLRDGTSAKAASIMLGYKDAQHFNHDFKKCFGVSPWSFASVLV